MSKPGDECLQCGLPLPDDGNVTICSECSHSYHFGSCSGITEASFKRKSENAREEWKCPTCRKGLQRSQSAKEAKPSEVDIARMFSTISEKLEILSSLKGTVDGIEHSVQMMSDKYDEIMTQLTSQNVVIKDLKARVEKIEDSRCEDEISQLKDDINDLEWRSRRLNLEFHGIPQTSGENLLEKLNDVATKMGVPDLSEAEVVSAHRLHLKSGQVPVIIARFANQLTRDQWLEKKKELKKNREPIFIQENMTRQNRVLLRAAKDWASAKRYQYVWHKQGKILLREKDGERAIVVRNIGDLQKVG